jgi:hypothetical protein
MSTKITDAEMTSDATRHTATAWPVPGEPTGWSVTWLPGRNLTRDQAITAMTIAEAVATHVDDLADNASPWWLHIDGWAAELGITGPEAVAHASLSPEDHADMPAVVTTAFDARPGRRGYLLSTDPATGTARVRIDGQTVTVPAAHLQHAGDEPVQADQDASANSALIGVMTADERAWLLAFIAGYAPGVFVAALGARSESFADELAARVEAREEAEYLAEDEGYCTVCGANVSWFLGYEGPQHFRGPHKLRSGAERRELFDADHAPAVAWRESPAAVVDGE